MGTIESGVHLLDGGSCLKPGLEMSDIIQWEIAGCETGMSLVVMGMFVPLAIVGNTWTAS